MINLDLGTLIDKPVKDVFAFVSNPNNMSKWNSAVVSLQQVTPGAVGVGTKFKSVGEAMGRRIEGEMQVVDEVIAQVNDDVITLSMLKKETKEWIDALK